MIFNLHFMGFKRLLTLGVFPLLLFLLSCAKKPVVNESAFIIIPHSQELKLGDQAASAILKKEKLVKDPRYTERVKRVFQRLLAALPPKYRKAYEWKVYVLDRNDINAFALPNGNIFVFKGLLDFVKNDDELAAVLGHEMAHVILRHGAEKMSWAMLAQLGEYALLSKVPAANRDLAARLYGLGVNVAFLLPYSRKQEKEADIVGVLLMMRAGYDPEGAVKLWEEMVKKFKDREPPEWLSDHPASEHRLEYIRKVVQFLKNHPQYVEKFEIPQKLLEED